MREISSSNAGTLFTLVTVDVGQRKLGEQTEAAVRNPGGSISLFPRPSTGQNGVRMTNYRDGHASNGSSGPATSPAVRNSQVSAPDAHRGAPGSAS